MNSLYIKSYAKLNLYLRVLNKRRDNYHNIITLFEKIDLYDEIRLSSRQDTQVEVVCNHPHVPLGKSNLAYQAACLIKKDLGINKGIDIKIKKRIPIASGLGGGSSNAAAVLIGLNRLWDLGLNFKKLVNYGKRLGADVPFFLYEASFALGQGRGDQIKTIPIKNRFWHVLFVPKIRVLTESVYKGFDRVFKVESLKLTNALDDVKILTLGLKKNNFNLLRALTCNDLETVAYDLYPELEKVKGKLLDMRLRDISMSGSGPAMFVFVSSRKEGKRLCRQLGRIREFKAFLVKTS